MARKKAKKEVSRKEINGNIIITFDDGSIQIIPAPIELSSEEASSIFGSSEEEEEEEIEKLRKAIAKELGITLPKKEKAKGKKGKK